MKVVLLASGKGGTGKTSVTAGVGAALAQLGQKVLAIDGDFGLRNLDIALGMSDRIVYSFGDVARGSVSLSDAAVRHPSITNLFLLTSPSDITGITDEGMQRLADEAAQQGFAYVLLDGPAGLPTELSLLAAIATQALIVTTPENSSIRGAERAARRLEDMYHIARIRVIVNRLRPKLIYHGNANTVDDVMDTAGLPLLGIVPEDEAMIICGNLGRSVLEQRGKGASLAFRNIARRLEGERVPLMRL